MWFRMSKSGQSAPEYLLWRYSSGQCIRIQTDSMDFSDERAQDSGLIRVGEQRCSPPPMALDAAPHSKTKRAEARIVRPTFPVNGPAVMPRVTGFPESNP
jgi:hypothetical protein